jgi:hypothetical protein
VIVRDFQSMDGLTAARYGMPYITSLPGRATSNTRKFEGNVGLKTAGKTHGVHTGRRCVCYRRREQRSPLYVSRLDANEFGIGSAHNVGCYAAIHEGTGWVPANRDAEIQGLGAIRARRGLANQRKL